MIIPRGRINGDQSWKVSDDHFALAMKATNLFTLMSDKDAPWDGLNIHKEKVFCQEKNHNTQSWGS
jgi:hypothetical protein